MNPSYVVLHLILWLGFGIAVGLTGWVLALALLSNSDDGYSSYYYDYYSDYYGSNYVNSLQPLIAFLALLVVVHFILSVRACVETAQRNKLKAPIIMMPQQMYYGPGPKPGYTMQHPVQPGYPTSPDQAHLTGYRGQTKEVNHHTAG
ncbi:Uu.00g007910.m01.CDS01 [Anthostomella pinea]|uniref:Uu.00g007910.m01.CDS01 n=1 Tax=Anthostomella pinea TaxID=933095 RepID=A0AAI8VX35_9PEZI|nr:Uu.00g007910.m01.CDS01 [Anthostomella pinea]